MKLSKHAKARAQQRGKKTDLLTLISIFGEVIEERNGCKILQITERIRRQIIQLLDKSPRTIIVADEQLSSIITTYSLRA